MFREEEMKGFREKLGRRQWKRAQACLTVIAMMCMCGNAIIKLTVQLIYANKTLKIMVAKEYAARIITLTLFIYRP